MGKDLTELTLRQTQEALKKKEFSSQELTEVYLKRIENHQTLNAYIRTCPEIALEMAKQSDQRLARGEGGILEGIPLGIKDAFCTKGIETTSASRILKGFVPPYESTVTQKIKDQGAVFLGKTNQDEFCMGSTNTTSAWGTTLNPWNTDCVPGGSSGGSAAAVSAHLAVAALGTDTGGSIRQPAAFCGIVGVRPTYGRCSRWGMTAFSSSLDQAGPMTRTVEDSAILLEAMCGYDVHDSQSADLDVPHFSSYLGKSVKGCTVGIPQEFYGEQLHPDILDSWDRSRAILEAAGCRIKMVSLPLSSYSLPCYYLIVCAEAASNLARYDGVKYGMRVPSDALEDMYCQTRAEGFGDEVKRRILIGTYVLSHGYYEAYYGKATRMRSVIIEEFKRVFNEGVDIMLCPTTPTPAFPIHDMPHDPVTVYMNDILTVPVNIGSVCALSLPCGLSKATNMPLGMQVIAPSFQEDRLFQFAHILEQAYQFSHRPPLLRAEGTSNAS